MLSDMIKNVCKGKRIVIASGSVVSSHPIDAPGAWQTFDAYCACSPNYAVTYLYNGEVKGEYGRPLTNQEILEALTAAGMI